MLNSPVFWNHTPLVHRCLSFFVSRIGKEVLNAVFISVLFPELCVPKMAIVPAALGNYFSLGLNYRVKLLQLRILPDYIDHVNIIDIWYYLNNKVYEIELALNQLLVFLLYVKSILLLIIQLLYFAHAGPVLLTIEKWISSHRWTISEHFSTQKH